FLSSGLFDCLLCAGFLCGRSGRPLYRFLRCAGASGRSRSLYDTGTLLCSSGFLLCRACSTSPPCRGGGFLPGCASRLSAPWLLRCRGGLRADNFVEIALLAAQRFLSAVAWKVKPQDTDIFGRSCALHMRRFCSALFCPGADYIVVLRNLRKIRHSFSL